MDPKKPNFWDYPNTLAYTIYLISLNTDSRVRYREGFLTFPTRELKKPTRLRGKFAKNKFTFIRFASDRAIIPLSECEFRISNKY